MIYLYKLFHFEDFVSLCIVSRNDAKLVNQIFYVNLVKYAYINAHSHTQTHTHTDERLLMDGYRVKTLTTSNSYTSKCHPSKLIDSCQVLTVIISSSSDFD